MGEHNCNEWGLFENPSWLLEHYFQNSGVLLDEDEKKEIFNFLETRNGSQIMEAFLCPLNRHATKEECGLSDEDFLEDSNHTYLLKHYIKNGGAAAFAKKREEKKKGELCIKKI